MAFYRWHLIVLLTLSASLSQLAFAQNDPVVINTTSFNKPLQWSMSCLTGQKANISATKLLNTKPQEFMPLDIFKPYYSKIPLWCRLALDNKTTKTLKTALTVPLPQKYFQMYELGSDRSVLLPARSISDIENPSIVFGLDLLPGPKEIYVHFLPMSPYRLLIDPTLMDEASYKRGSSEQLIFLMLSIGILFALGIYYFMSGLALRSPSNIYYAFTNFLLAALMISQAGYINLSFVQGRGFTSQVATLNRMIVVALMVVFCIYSIHFLDVHKRFLRLSKLIKTGGKAWIALIIINEVLISFNPGIRPSSLYTLSFFNLFIPVFFISSYVIIQGLLSRHKMTFILLLSFTPVFTVFFLSIVIPQSSGFVDWADALSKLSLGISLTSISLGIALAYNLSIQRKNAEQMRSMMIATHTVQSALLPAQNQDEDSLNHSDPIEITSYYSAANHAGGDWFSYHLDAAKEHFLMQICDVTGHGIPAAIITGVITGAAYSCLEDIEQNPDESPETQLRYMAHKINRVLIKTGARVNCFATMSLVYLNTRTGQGLVCGAGHPPVYVFGGDRVKTLVSRGSILGFQEHPEFQIKAFTISPGESLFCYTDGLLENTNQKGEPIKTRTLQKVLNQKSPAGVIKDEIIRLVENHLNGKAYDDDVSFVIAGYRGLTSKQKETA